MRLSLEKLRTEKRYRIGYIPLIDEYVMAIINGNDECQYDDYYRITPKIYEMHTGDIKRLDQTAEHLRDTACKDENFLFSENPKNNTISQKDMYFECRDSQKERVNGSFVRI